MKRKFDVGQRVWEFSANRRVYPKGKRVCGPIYSEHFSPLYVVGIEGRRYVMHLDPTVRSRAFPGKVGFEKAERTYKTDAEREAMIWKNEYAYKLKEAVGRCQDIEVLKKVAELIGYLV